MTSTATPTTATTGLPRYSARYDDARWDAAVRYDEAARYDAAQFDARRYDEPARYDAAPLADPNRTRVDQLRFWVGSVMTAAIVAVAVAIGSVITHGIAKVPFGSLGDGTVVHSATYAAIAAVLALLAAGLYAAMLQVAPRPTLYWSWLVVLLTALAAVLPFAAAGVGAAAIALAAMNVVVGLIVLTLVPYAAENARIA